MRRVLALLAVLFLVAGCGAGEFKGVYDLPLPGGADLGDHPYRVTVQFADVLDLVPHAAVKVNDVAVGRVESINLGADGWTAEVVAAVNGDVHLPANAVARLRQTSLLGEKFVELAAPGPENQPPPATRLTDGAVIPTERTNRNPEVEEVFGALSLLLNGGGIGQLQTINQELTKVMSGNEEQIRSFLANLNTLVSNLDTHKQDITRALDGLNALSATLSARNQQISDVLDNLSPGLATLVEQRDDLVTMLQSLDNLSTVAVDTINRSREDMVADLHALAPILRNLAAAGQDLPGSLEVLLTFPFTDKVTDAIKGDYLNVFVNVTPAPGVPIPPPDPARQPALGLPPVGPVVTVPNNAGGR